ncbi:hypothetical protein GSI_05614 [Ganoderma sinense ZZ0214-1]|uniref:Uncharacterized protein n=1 Tax=Ganoderma sinense ZZ0214-1 TaxID=1077348 RepID=A0A2G8SFJ9_9APHY|nr:hypothetical protein GSI_05614 [Ganoderma sinense ZZ0214-1]
MAPLDQPPDIPNAFVDQSSNPVTLTRADSSTVFTPLALFHAYTKYDIDIRNGRTGGAVPVGYAEFAGRWNEDGNCPYRFSTFNSATAVVTTVGAPFPAGFLNSIDPPSTPRAPMPPTTFKYTAGQNDLI